MKGRRSQRGGSWWRGHLPDDETPPFGPAVLRSSVKEVCEEMRRQAWRPQRPDWLFARAAHAAKAVWGTRSGEGRDALDRSTGYWTEMVETRADRLRDRDLYRDSDYRQRPEEAVPWWNCGAMSRGDFRGLFPLGGNCWYRELFLSRLCQSCQDRIFLALLSRIDGSVSF